MVTVEKWSGWGGEILVEGPLEPTLRPYLEAPLLNYLLVLHKGGVGASNLPAKQGELAALFALHLSATLCEVAEALIICQTQIHQLW
jgi:hypothetical protein